MTLKVENDLFASSDDGHYTSGVELGWTFAAEPSHWSQQVARWVPNFLLDEVDGVSYRFTHEIYTPDDINRRELIEDDRPYAGVLLLGLSLHEDKRIDQWRQASDLHFDVGVVGPGARAEQLQREVHRITNSDNPRGWEHQLSNEPVINATYRRQWWYGHRLGGLTLEHGPSVTGAVGNLYTYAGGGYGMRLGEGLQRSYGTPAVSPAQGGRQYFTTGDRFGWYAFASLEGRYMAQNMLLDGNTFTSSHSVDKRNEVGDALVGAALTWQRWQLSYTHVWRTREFHGQDGTDSFGSMTVSRHF
nr:MULTISPECIES: lipid A deacylase LpxR family protein [Halomonas]